MNLNHKGFTLLELLIVVGIIAILAAITIVGINPARQIANTRNAQRQAHVATIQGAINHFAVDTFSGYPPGIDSTLRMLGTASSGCSLLCGPETVATITSTFLDDIQADFSNGTFNNTQWNTASTSVTLNATGLTNKTGDYLSSVKDAGANQTWTTFSWLPFAPYTKELPDNQQLETGYPSGNANMANNLVLLHMNQSSGGVVDSSGNNNNGSVTGSVSGGAAGKLNSSMSFNGSTNNYVSIPHASALNLPTSGGTVMLWIKPTITSGSIPQNTGMGVIRKHDYAPNTYSPGGYGIEIYRNLANGPANVRGFLGTNNGSASTQQAITGATALANATWYHVAFTWSATTMNLYVNGNLEATATRTTGLGWSSYATGPVYIGHNNAGITGSPPAWYSGNMDELAMFSRQLSAAEILAAYQRGGLRLRAQVRTCDDALCNGETLKGPAGTSSDYYDELINTTSSTPNLPITSQIPGRYFQYQMFFDTDTSAYSPELRTVSASNNASGSGSTATTETTASACLDLSSSLYPTYITSLPYDPQVGSAARTYYAVKKLNMDNVIVRACSPELGKSIQVSQ